MSGLWRALRTTLQGTHIFRQDLYGRRDARRLFGYLLIGVELIAETIENPFVDTVDDLSLGEFCHTIEKSVSEILPAPRD